MEVELQTACLPTSERFDYWREEIARFLVAQDLRPDIPANFQGRATIRTVGGVGLLHSRSTQLASSREPRHVRADDDGSVYIIVPRAAEGVLAAQGQEATIAPDRMFLLRSDCPFEVWYDGPIDVLFAKLSSELLDERVGIDAVPRFLSLDTSRPLESVLRHAVEVACCADYASEQLGVGAMGSMGAIMCELFAGVLNSSVGATRLAAENHLARYLEYIRVNIADPELSAVSIAEAHRVCVGTVHKAFRSTGRSAGATILEMRLRRCRAALANPLMAHRSITEIALSLGFNDAAYFSRAFRRRFALSPREWRRQRRFS